MLRTALYNASRFSARLPRRVAAPSLQLLARHQSSKANDQQALKAARKLNDKLQENWRCPTLTYEQLKPRTLSPSNVWAYPLCCLLRVDILSPRMLTSLMFGNPRK